MSCSAPVAYRGVTLKIWTARLVAFSSHHRPSAPSRTIRETHRRGQRQQRVQTPSGASRTPSARRADANGTSTASASARADAAPITRRAPRHGGRGRPARAEQHRHRVQALPRARAPIEASRARSGWRRRAPNSTRAEPTRGARPGERPTRAPPNKTRAWALKRG